MMVECEPFVAWRYKLMSIKSYRFDQLSISVSQPPDDRRS